MKRHIEKRSKPDFRVMGRIYAKFAKDAPSIGSELEQWVHATAEEINVTEELVLDCVGRYFEHEKLKNDGHRYTEAQRLTLLMGHTKSEVIARLYEMLYATKSELIYRQDKEGKFVELDPNGDPMVHEQPDWKAVGEAARQINQIQGSFAPEQLVVDMNQRVEVTHQLSDTELNERWQRTIAQLPAHVRGVLAPAGIGSAQTGRRNEGAGGTERPIVLDVELHQDEGRAGR